MKTILPILLLLIIVPNLHAQQVNFRWAKQFDGTGIGAVTDMSVDAAGNVYTTGSFSGTYDFDPGPGLFELTAQGLSDMFICKLDSAGNFAWAMQIGGTGEDWSSSIALGNNGEVYTTGQFYGTVDFDPGPGVYNMSTVSWRDMFISRLDTGGNFTWAKQIGGAGVDCGNYIATDQAGNIFLNGNFSGSSDFDPGPNVFNLTSLGITDIFICKLDAAGIFNWAKQVPVTHFNYVFDIAVDNIGNVYTTGDFAGAGDFDPGPANYNLVSAGDYDSYIIKLDGSGDFSWARHFGSSGIDGSYSIVVDAAENVYTSGNFTGAVDFEPGPGNFTLVGTSVYYQNDYLLKLDASGNLSWVIQLDGATANVSGLATDIHDNLYFSGTFSSSIDADPGPGTYNLSAYGGSDMYVTKINGDADFKWAIQLGGSGQCYGRQLAVDPFKSVYTAGNFAGTVDFDPGSNTYNLTWNGISLFVQKMTACLNFTSSTLHVTDCRPYTLNGQTYSTSGVYRDTILNSAGCDSIITLNLTINRVEAAVNATACNSYDWQGHVYQHSGIYVDTVITSNACDSIISLYLTIHHSVASAPINVTACNSYQWNGHTITSSGIYKDTLVTANGCDSIITLNLTLGNSNSSTHNVIACESYQWNGQLFIASGTYTDSLINATGCDSIVTLQLTIGNSSTSTLNATSCNSYNWNGETFTSSGSYTDTLVNANGCDSIAFLQLTIKPSSHSIIDRTICEGEQFEGYSMAGTYMDTLVAFNGCDSIRKIILLVLPRPAPNLGPDKEWCPGDSLLLSPGAFNTYLWQNGSTQKDLAIYQQGLYSVMVSNGCGTASDEILVKDGICDAYFPSAFTPNNDGQNDLFKMLGKTTTSEFHLLVFNRWGQKVFETRDPSMGWNGKLKGQSLSQGVFTWYCHFIGSGIKRSLKGTVLLIR